MIQVGDLFTVDVWSDICCEICNEIMWTYFEEECPICKSHNAHTTIDYNIKLMDQIFECEECGSKFKILDYDDDYDLKIELVELHLK